MSANTMESAVLDGDGDDYVERGLVSAEQFANGTLQAQGEHRPASDDLRRYSGSFAVAGASGAIVDYVPLSQTHYS